MKEKDLSDQDKIREEIRFKIEEFRLIAIGLLTVGGGTLSIVIDIGSPGVKKIFLAAGILISAALIVFGYQLYRIIKRLVK